MAGNTETKIPRLTFDTQRINEDVPIRAVIAAYTGTTPSERGNIPCPSVIHTDKNPSAHIYGNRCRCFTCGEAFTPITLAKEHYPDLSFAEVCEQLLKDFRMDIYDYSNLREVEAATQAKTENKCSDHFPLTERELNFIGLQNPRMNKPMYFPVGAISYFAYFDGRLPDDRSLLYDENGKEKLITVSEHEAVEMGIVTEDYIEAEKRHKYPKMQELWKESEEQREHIEEMILCYAREKADECTARFKTASEAFRETASKYSVSEWEKIKKIRDSRNRLIHAGKDVPVREDIKKKLDDLFILTVMNDTLFTPCYNDKQFADQILNKVLDLREQRTQDKGKNNNEKKKEAQEPWR